MLETASASRLTRLREGRSRLIGWVSEAFSRTLFISPLDCDPDYWCPPIDENELPYRRQSALEMKKKERWGK